MRELEFQVTRKENDRVAALAAADRIKRELDALQVWCAKLDFDVTSLHNEADVVE